jgi:hypothetical protein
MYEFLLPKDRISAITQNTDWDLWRADQTRLFLVLSSFIGNSKSRIGYPPHLTQRDNSQYHKTSFKTNIPVSNGNT